MSNNFDNLKEKIFLTSIDIIIFDGWSNKALFEAAEINGISSEDTKKIFPRGALDLVKYYHEYEDKIFLKKFREIDCNNLSHFKKIELALFKRFELIVENKEAFRRSMALFALPFNQIEGLNLVFSTCDKIWLEIGDKSLSYDWYTKRIILASIYLTSLLFLFGDNSSNHKETYRFISKRLNELKSFGKFKINYSKLFDFQRFKNL
ncbi:MAG: COQ9 family protein [Paracoccaceae bacterium]|tara:strand:- start:580 stop:1197 length:618 start_codon:yes stop_codon:yes gene_type:complete